MNKGLGFELKVVREIDFGKASEAAITSFLNKAVLAIHSATAQTSPVDTGRLRASLAPGNPDGLTTVQAPKFGRVGTNVEYALAQETKTRNAGWFRAGVEQGMAKLEGIAAEIGAEIKTQWNEGTL